MISLLHKHHLDRSSQSRDKSISELNNYSALACGSYRGVKLMEHAVKMFEGVVEGRVRKIVKIDNMQFGFMAGRSTKWWGEM